MRLILASQSASRRKAFDILGLKYEVIPSNIDEKAIRDSNPLVLVEKLAVAKAQEVSKIINENAAINSKQHSDAVIFAADQFCVFDGKIMEKPVDKAEAVRMLKSLSGNSFEIVSAVAVCSAGAIDALAGRTDVLAGKSTVTFRKISDEEISGYVSKWPVTNYAAAFNEDGLFMFSHSINGRFPPVFGFFMDDAVMLLRKHGVTV